MKLPTNKEFYICELKKEELNKIISEENCREREKGFINEYSSREGYYRLTKKSNFFQLKNDKFGKFFKKSFNGNNSFFANSTMHTHKKMNKKISHLFQDKITKNKNLSPFYKTIWTKKHNDKFSIKYRLLDILSIYLGKELRKDISCGKILPIIKKNKNNTTYNFFEPKISLFNIREKPEAKIKDKDSKEKIKDIEKFKEIKEKEKLKDIEKFKEIKEKVKEKFKEEIKEKIKFNNRLFENKKIDTSKYKEIKFQPTQAERE